MFALATVPVPWLTEQTCAGVPGCALIVTAKACPLATGVANANDPLPVTDRSSAPPFSRTNPCRPAP